MGEFSTACASKDKVSRINPAVCKSKNRRGEVRQKLMINSDRVSQAVGGGGGGGGGGGRGRGTPVGKRTLKSNSSLY